MNRWLAFAAVSFFVLSTPCRAEGLSGQYIEARTCDIWTGQCFANAEINMTGKNAVMGWKIDKGRFDGQELDGLGVVAVIATSDTLGLEQTGPAKAFLIVDARASKTQKEALVKFVKKQGGDLTKNVVAVESAKIDLTTCECENKSCVKLEAGAAHIETRCLKSHDKVCGHEEAIYPPLSQGVTARPAVAAEHGFKGDAFKTTWKETDRRGAYIGTFETK
jgi:hypothetical protein